MSECSKAMNDTNIPSPAARDDVAGGMAAWLGERRDTSFPDLMLVGEWCYAVHGVCDDQLPDWLLVFDVYDPASERFWCGARAGDSIPIGRRRAENERAAI